MGVSHRSSQCSDKDCFANLPRSLYTLPSSDHFMERDKIIDRDYLCPSSDLIACKFYAFDNLHVGLTIQCRLGY